MFRRDAWEHVGGFDEQFYPIWFEDVDFCKRLRDDGYQVYYEPGAVATHLGEVAEETLADGIERNPAPPGASVTRGTVELSGGLVTIGLRRRAPVVAT